MLGAPQLAAALQLGADERGAEQDDPLLLPAVDAAQDTGSFPGLKHTFLTHAQFFTQRYPHVRPCRAALQPVPLPLQLGLPQSRSSTSHLALLSLRTSPWACPCPQGWLRFPPRHQLHRSAGHHLHDCGGHTHSHHLHHQYLTGLPGRAQVITFNMPFSSGCLHASRLPLISYQTCRAKLKNRSNSCIQLHLPTHK